LMMSDGWGEGGLHWQIGEDGKLILGVRGPAAGKLNGHYHAPGVFTAERLKRWTQLATVYDRAKGLVTHYVDGQPVSAVAITVEAPLRVGAAELGNRNVASFSGKQPVRYFSGCMDEFLLFSRALTAQEVERFYAQSRPPA